MDVLSLYVAAAICSNHIHHTFITGKIYWDEGFGNCEVIRLKTFEATDAGKTQAFVDSVAVDLVKQALEKGGK